MKTDQDKEKYTVEQFETLVLEHHKRLLAYALSMGVSPHVAEDLVQDAFVTAFLKFDEFDSSRSFPAWMRGIVRFKYLEHLRKNREISLTADILDSIDNQFAQLDNQPLDDKTLFSTLEKCLEKLSPDARKTVDLFYFKSMSGEEAAENLQCNEVTVRKRLQRARYNLGRCLNREEVHDESK